MECMKCGREMEAGEVFCVRCRSSMEPYPIKAETVIQLPQRKEDPAQRKNPPRRRTPTDQEKITHLTRSNRILRVSLVLAMILLCLLGYGTKVLMDKLDEGQYLGRNYSSSDTTGNTGTWTITP